MDEQHGKQKAKEYYGQGAEAYIKQYQEGYEEYPANRIRLDFIIERLKKNNVKTVLDVGCGTCGPMIRLLQEGFTVKGFDFSKEMIDEGKKELAKSDYDPELITLVDLENEAALPGETFDSIIALGVFPHIVNEEKALSNMAKLLRPSGLVFIEFRNSLFAAYTLNKYSLEFFLNDVIDLNSLPRDMREPVAHFYSERMKVDAPIKKENDKVAYADILTKFRNPLSIGSELFNPCGFSVADIHFYHYHALPPIFQQTYPKEFRELSLKMEKTSDWRGYLMASAYVIEAKKVA